MAPLYIPQDDLELIPKDILKAEQAKLDQRESLIRHALMAEYFDFYDHTNYTPRPWLRRIYPKG